MRYCHSSLFVPILPTLAHFLCVCFLRFYSVIITTLILCFNCIRIHLLHVLINMMMMMMMMKFAVVERILEKHSSAALQLCEKRLNISALPPIRDALPLLSHEIDDRRLLFSNLPDSVSTESFKTYLRKASTRQDHGRRSAVMSVIFSLNRGTAMAAFRQPYGKYISALFFERVRVCYIL